MEMRFIKDGKTNILKAITNSNLKVISFRHIQRLVQHDTVDWEVECRMSPKLYGTEKTAYHPNIQQLRTKHSKVFSDIPPRRPPDRVIEHIIELG